MENEEINVLFFEHKYRSMDMSESETQKILILSIYQTPTGESSKGTTTVIAQPK
jgi:hypothetical protein